MDLTNNINNNFSFFIYSVHVLMMRKGEWGHGKKTEHFGSSTHF